MCADSAPSAPWRLRFCGIAPSVRVCARACVHVNMCASSRAGHSAGLPAWPACLPVRLPACLPICLPGLACLPACLPAAPLIAIAGASTCPRRRIRGRQEPRTAAGRTRKERYGRGAGTLARSHAGPGAGYGIAARAPRRRRLGASGASPLTGFPPAALPPSDWSSCDFVFYFFAPRICPRTLQPCWSTTAAGVQ